VKTAPRPALLAVTSDLVFRSKIDLSLRPTGFLVRFAQPAGWTDTARELEPELVLLDASDLPPGSIEALRAFKSDPATREIPVVAYGPHRDLAARDAIRSAGADDVVANSEVATSLGELVGRWAKRAAGRETRLRLGHSPDPDDAFMFYALAAGKIDTEGLVFDQELRDIETLNRMALEGSIEITAASVHACAHLADRYAILSCGGSFGEGYGPVLVARGGDPGPLPAGAVVGVPGTLTSAFLALRLFAGEFAHRVLPFDRIPERVLDGTVDAGLLIHEGQLTYSGAGLVEIVDLGEWWRQQTALPLPLGVNIVRKDLGADRCRLIARLLRASVDYALTHREEALGYAMRFGRGLQRGLADRFVGMYVNERTRDMGPEGRRAIAEFLDRGHRAGVLPHPVHPGFVEE
jgi:1,4-dihydroxy-6-naphthoate synthase